MPNISVELVPRDLKGFKKQLALLRAHFPRINTLNIPDILRFDMRSWQAAIIAKEYFSNVILHLRAIDFDLSKPFDLCQYIHKNRLKSVLVIKGDKPQDMTKRVYRNTSLELIRVIKKEMPEMKVYAGLDPYRTSLREELDYIKDKRIAGVDGFFTQPFFDIRLLNIYLDLLKDEAYEVFWGICPILNDKSKSYWESKNNVVFPSDFSSSMDWNVHFAQEAMAAIRHHRSNAYFMPVRINAVEFLTTVLEDDF